MTDMTQPDDCAALRALIREHADAARARTLAPHGWSQYREGASDALDMLLTAAEALGGEATDTQRLAAVLALLERATEAGDMRSHVLRAAAALATATRMS